MKESAGDADSLFFATREGVSEFACFCVVAFGKAHDEVVDGRFAGGFHDLLARRARLADCDVVGYGIMEQVGLLCHVAFHVAEMLCRNLSHVFAVYVERAGIHIPETHQQLEKCGFTLSCQVISKKNIEFTQKERLPISAIFHNSLS